MPPTKTFIEFKDVSSLYRRKTKVIEIYSMWGSQIGEIKWYTPWRKYCFFPGDSTIFDAGCMDIILAKITELMDKKNVDTESDRAKRDESLVNNGDSHATRPLEITRVSD